MLPPRKVLWPFALRFCGILAVYMLPFRPIGYAYGGAMAAIANRIVRAGGAPETEAVLHFSPLERGFNTGFATEAFNILLLARNASTGAAIRIPIDLRTLAYVPTVVFIALSVAAPIWEDGRGARVLILGLAVLQVFLALSIAVPLILFFANPEPMPLVALGTGVHRALDILYRALVAPPGMAFAIPGLLWLLMLWIVPGPSSGGRSAQTAV